MTPPSRIQLITSTTPRARKHLWYGSPFTGKSSAAVIGGPVDHYEFEDSGLPRAENVRTYNVQTPISTDLGEVIVTGSNNAMPSARIRLEGWAELWDEFWELYLTNIVRGEGRPVIDTGTRAWLACRQGWEQALQDAVGKESERLGQLRYSEMNRRWLTMLEAPVRYGKDLIVVSHQDTVFGTNQVKADTQKETENTCDVTLRFSVKNGKPVGTIVKMRGADLKIVGMEIVEPTLELVNSIADAAALLDENKFPLPDSVELILKTAEMVKG